MKNGFTLIELLAVIIVLAAILAIVTPIVTGVIKDSKNKTKIASLELYGRALEQAAIAYELDKDEEPSSLEDIEPYLKYSGKKVECENTFIGSGGKYYIENCSIDGKMLRNSSYGTMSLGDRVIAHAIKNNYYYDTVPNFNSSTYADEFGVYLTEDDLGDSYYFRGDVENNYVQFGKWSEITSNKYHGVDYFIGDGYDTYEECMRMHTENGAPWTECTTSIDAKEGDLMYWRIVRINGDGTIRLVYDGTKAVENQENHGVGIGVSAYDSNMNVKYSYLLNGVQKDSTIKGVIDKWYNEHLKKDYEKYISDSIFCNDAYSGTKEYLFIYDQESYESGMGGYTEMIGYPSIERLFALNEKLNPTLKCINKDDRYTVSDIKNGNGLLDNPIALLTGDEVTLAGTPHGGGSAPINYLYHGNEAYYTMTPSFEDSVFFVGENMEIADLANAIKHVRPVINLKVNVEFTGTGTIDNPYVIITE